MKSALKIIIGCLVLLAAGAAVAIEQRFDLPDFETGYGLPDLYTPNPPAGEAVWDALVLFGALAITTWLVLKKRSRRGLFLMSIFSLGWFGFYRQGCICPVGSLQNVAAAVMLPDVGVSWVVLSFFLLPLLFSLFFGRVFCASVCPLGAIQELVAIAPIRISHSLERVLGLGKYLYLGLAILGIGTGTGFLVCRFDPFVGLYRFGHSFGMLLAGAVILLLGVFVARPYCRFLCPYGVLLGWMSKFSKWHLDIAPKGACVDCRLCEDSCPYNAIDMPTPPSMVDEPAVGVSRVRRFVFAAPIIILLGGLTGVFVHEALARMNSTIRLSERVAAEDLGLVAPYTSPLTTSTKSTEQLQMESFREGEKTTDQLHAEATVIRASFKTGSAWFGAFMGLMISLKLIGLSIARKRTVYEPNREACYSCGRCYPYCPVEPEGALP